MIAIVTVLFNSSKVLPDFFSSLDNQTYKDFVLFVIDNASPDDSLKITRELSAKVSFKSIILPQTNNWGVAKGNNIGIKQAIKGGFEYVLLSNNDVVLEPDCIEKLLIGIESMQTTLAVPKIYFYNTNKMIWSAGGKFSIYNCGSPHRGSQKQDEGQFDRNCLIDYAPTCFMLIKTDVFERVGLMDENYFVYYDDADFVWRALRNKNEKMSYIPSSVLWHKESYSTGGCLSDFYIHYYYRNRVFFARKHFNFFQRFLFYTYLIIHYFVRGNRCFNQEQKKLYRNSCIEGWKYYNQKKGEYAVHNASHNMIE